jgi:CHASE2 domain-containing sensor protein
MSTSPARRIRRSLPRRGSGLTSRRSSAATLAILIAGAVAICAGVAVYLTGAATGFEQSTINKRFQLRHVPPPRGISLVNIDDVTFSDLQKRWPLRRSLHAQVIDRIAAAHPKEIVYDVQFTEPSAPSEDLALYRAVARAGGAVLATIEIDDHGHTNVLGGDQNLAAVHAQAAASNLLNQSDGSGHSLVTSFPYAISGLRTVGVTAAERATGVGISGASFPSGGALIDYRGGSGTFPAVSFSHVLRGEFDPSIFRNQIVVVGVSDPTLQDVHPTPMSGSNLMSGPEVQANAIWTALHGLPLHTVPPVVNVALIILMGMLVPLGRLRLRILPMALAAPMIAGLFLFASQLAFDHGLILAVVSPMFSLALGTVGALVTSHVVESQARQRVSLDNELLEERVHERTEELRETQLEIVRRLGQAAESRDGETGLHIERMSRLCQRLARAVGMSVEEADLLRHASVMHDVGKIGIPDRVLLKAGSFTREEWETMKSHTTIGAVILAGSRSPLVRMAETVALTHHERWDGSGYPAGLRREEIPLVGRICAICDVFDALLSKRPYKDAWSMPAAVQEIRGQSGRHFDPQLVDAFLELVPELEQELLRGALPVTPPREALTRRGSTPRSGAAQAGAPPAAIDGLPGLRPAGAEAAG